MTKISSTKPDISIIIPAYNEAESLRELCPWINQVLKEHELSYEILVIDDGSTDNTSNLIREMIESKADSNLKLIRFIRNYGKSAVLYTGFQMARGTTILSMDADLQDSPDEIPELYHQLRDRQFDLISGWKKDRKDPFIKRISSRLFNYITSRVSGIPIHDFNSGLKIYRKEVAQNIYLHGEMHRYIPLIAHRNGFLRIAEKSVIHYPRKYGKSKYKSDRFLKGFLDLLSISFVSRFRERPMHFFGGCGLSFFLIGSLLVLYLIGNKKYNLMQGIPVREVVDQPLFYLSLITVIIGVQMFLTGFLAEILSLHFSRKENYLIAEKLGFDNKNT
ncbi:MAG: glycosyltransferase family 2 protein [Cytophagales bacterium]|nr:glycosyltransferase family 2 protein [Cytophagales bacterium]